MKILNYNDVRNVVRLFPPLLLVGLLMRSACDFFVSKFINLCIQILCSIYPGNSSARLYFCPAGGTNGLGWFVC
jgi:hypothetical protein